MTKTGEFVKASSLKLRLKNNLIEATCNPFTTSGYLITPIGLLIIP